VERRREEGRGGERRGEEERGGERRREEERGGERRREKEERRRQYLCNNTTGCATSTVIGSLKFSSL
jgi:hypothetical protein